MSVDFLLVQTESQKTSWYCLWLIGFCVHASFATANSQQLEWQHSRPGLLRAACEVAIPGSGDLCHSSGFLHQRTIVSEEKKKTKQFRCCVLLRAKYDWSCSPSSMQNAKRPPVDSPPHGSCVPFFDSQPFHVWV